MMDKPRLHMSGHTWGNILSEMEVNVMGLCEKLLVDHPIGYLFGCPIILSDAVQTDTVVLVKSTCEYCGQDVGLFNKCPKCGAPKNTWDSSEVVYLRSQKEGSE